MPFLFAFVVDIHLRIFCQFPETYEVFIVQSLLGAQQVIQFSVFLFQAKTIHQLLNNTRIYY